MECFAGIRAALEILAKKDGMEEEGEVCQAAEWNAQTQREDGNVQGREVVRSQVRKIRNNTEWQ